MKSRTQNSMRNLAVAIAMQFVSVVAAFACRTVFARLLAEEYLGISGLFTNIISILSLSELGIGSVIIIHLYDPIARKDKKQICQLMNFYSCAYTLIGLFVLVCGIVLTPFLHHLVMTEQAIPHLEVYFLLFVAQAASSYFFAYKRSILIASQNEYICVAVTQIFELLMKAGQILALWLTHKFILYLIVAIITNLGANIVLSIVADKKYPYLKNKAEKLPKPEIKSMLHDVSSMMLHKVGNTVVTSTDNILISSMIGIVYTGRYSNYILLMNMVTQGINIFLTSISASLGDYNAQKSCEERKKMFESLCFLTQWVFGFGMIGFICLFQPTISIWLGDRFLLDFGIVLIVSLNFYLNGIFRIPATFVDLNGLYNKTKWKPIAVAVINLVISVIAAKLWGLIGIFIGTLAGYLLISVWADPYYLYKDIWKSGLSFYFLSLGRYFAVTGIICAVTYAAVYMIPFYVLKVFVTVLLPNVCYILLYHRRAEFHFLFDRFFKKRSNN